MAISFCWVKLVDLTPPNGVVPAPGQPTVRLVEWGSLASGGTEQAHINMAGSTAQTSGLASFSANASILVGGCPTCPTEAMSAASWDPRFDKQVPTLRGPFEAGAAYDAWRLEAASCKGDSTARDNALTLSRAFSSRDDAVAWLADAAPGRGVDWSGGAAAMWLISHAN